jgi:hypothetical protein
MPHRGSDEGARPCWIPQIAKQRATIRSGPTCDIAELCGTQAADERTTRLVEGCNPKQPSELVHEPDRTAASAGRDLHDPWLRYGESTNTAGRDDSVSDR